MSFQGQFTQTAYGPMFVGYILASLPLIIIFMFGMQCYIRGLTSGAIKA